MKTGSNSMSAKEAASAKARLIRGIEKYWSGKFGGYKVTTHVVKKLNGKGKGLSNTIYLYPGSNRSMCTGNTGVWYTGWKNLEWTGAHEAGHLMGLGDRYDHKTGKPQKGWSNNIMGKQNKPVQARNISELVVDRGAAGLMIELAGNVIVERR